MITVLGSINMDLVALVERLPGPGETVSGSSFTTSPGGKGANQALAARRAGADVRMVGAVGSDSFAQEALQILRQAGVNLKGVSTSTEHTGTALIYVAENGENTIAVVPGANAAVGEEHVRTALEGMSDGDPLVLQMEVPGATIAAAINAARRKGIRTILNIAPATSEIASLAELVDIIVANETEFEQLLGQRIATKEDRTQALLDVHARRGQTVVVTLGAEGVAAVAEGQIFTAMGLPIEPVDTVGAGDTFVGYLAVALAENLPFAKALRMAAVAGSLACMSRGAQPAMPLRDEVERQLSQTT
ncbi:ribokinase [Brucella sp. BE17]|uniref:ribokinase n=1 Tax=Brucella sp. BE17 TaxID=3142977 RepID=UPI0031BB670E